jgi:hypothetical protein
MATRLQKAATRRYTLYFDGSALTAPNPDAVYPLRTGALADAKLQAALIYACADAAAGSHGYRIVGNSGRVVYRYPEQPAA